MGRNFGIQELREASLRVVRQIIDLPVHHLFGRRGGYARHESGAAPGTLFDNPEAASTRLEAYWIAPDGGIEHFDPVEPEAIPSLLDRPGGLWIDVAGLADRDLIRRLGELFELHPLTLADLANVEGQIKLDELENYTTIVTRIPHLSTDERHPGLNQLGLVLGSGWLLSFREHPGGLFDSIRERLANPASRLRNQPLDYLASALLDQSVESCFPVVETLSERIDEMEEAIMAGRGNALLPEIHANRRALIALGRLFWRQRDLTGRLLRDEKLFSEATGIYLRDMHDRSIQLLDLVETARELATSLIDIHLSISANRSNQIMKTLTIIASIFIPLTFLAGLYGMNFAHMPELEKAWGYPAVLLVMLLIGIGMLLWFRRRGWLDDQWAMRLIR